ncbi:hypothetical protein DFP72DRAFT_1063431 [Ephemerocybe angulata]|uniref:Uncharacterized protein n=1 Tax=Ephemerocybe angulata TaxID=980116 RepID=A0A8H6MD57_9AGAR|nr:hypothetical protein DFP72DRAFT_1063431 [Tulosesus angulatus]
MFTRPHGIVDPWVDDPTRPGPDLSYVNIMPYGNWMLESEQLKLTPSMCRDALSRNRQTKWLIRRLRLLIITLGRGCMINPSRDSLGRVQGLACQHATYFVMPISTGLLRADGTPKVACFTMVGYVAESWLLGKGFRHRVDVPNSAKVDRRLRIYPLEGEYQRAIAYLGAAAHEQNIAFGFNGTTLTFMTRTKDEIARQFVTTQPTSSGALPLISVHQTPGPYQLEDDERYNNLKHIEEMDFPVALKYESKVPIFDARRQSTVFGDAILWEQMLQLPLWEKELPIGSLVTVGYTAFTTNGVETQPSNLIFPIQFVVLHLAH